MHLFIPNYSLKYAKRLLTWLQGKQKCLCVAWIINWALQIDCNTRVRYGANKLVSKVGIETDLRVLQKIYIILYSFCILSKSFTRPFEVKQLPNLPLNLVPQNMEIICFWFQTMKNDWVWRKYFERFITILNVSIDIIGVLFLQVVSIFKKL